MLIYESHQSQKNVSAIEKFCKEKKWNYCNWDEITGSESSVVILYCHDDFHYECFTRAKHQLMIATIHNRKSSEVVKALGQVCIEAPKLLKTVVINDFKSHAVRLLQIELENAKDDIRRLESENRKVNWELMVSNVNLR